VEKPKRRHDISEMDHSSFGSLTNRNFTQGGKGTVSKLHAFAQPDGNKLVMPLTRNEPFGPLWSVKPPAIDRLSGGADQLGYLGGTAQKVDDCCSGFTVAHFSQLYDKRNLVNPTYTKPVIAGGNGAVYDKRMKGKSKTSQLFKEWLVEGLAQPGKTGVHLAKLLGLPQPRIAEMKSGLRQPKSTELRIISEYLERQLPDYMLPESAPTRVPFVSWVQAGAFADSGPVEAEQAVVPLELGAGRWLAFRVEGDSMDRISPPNSLILINADEKRLVPNACYVVCDESGAGTYKRYRPNPNRFEPVSTNPAHEALFPTGAITVIGRVRKTILEM
jgi:SOS-response transcriptional repressor LexA